MNDSDRVKFQKKIIETMQAEYDELVAYYDGIEDELLGAKIELAMAQKQLNQMGINEYSFAGAERKLN